MMEALLRKWDGEAVVAHYNRHADAWIFIALHSTRLGPAMGGTRMKHYPDQEAALRDALRQGGLYLAESRKTVFV